MVNDNQKLLDFVTKVREGICDECQKIAYFAPVEYQQCCARILNASTIVYEDIMNMIFGNAHIGIKTHLSLATLVMLQEKVLNILFEPENIIKKEKIMRRLFLGQNISPKNYFKLNDKISEFLPTFVTAD